MQVWGVSTDTLMVLPCSSYSVAGFRPPSVDLKLFPSSSDSRPGFSNKCYSSIGWPNIGFQLEKYRARRLKVKALENSAAIDQQLERLQSDRDAEKEETPPATQDLLLYRRIAEVKAKERQKALEEIIYCLIVQKFMDNDISMIPAISPSSDPNSEVHYWPNQEHKLEAIHSPDALEMIQSHLTLILGERAVGPLNAIVQISKLKLGKLYAASIMYGYFLKRVDQRFQLERTMKTLPTDTRQQRVFDDLKPNPLWDLESMVQISSDDDGSDGEDSKSYRLRSYVMYLDAEALQRYATIRSKESISLIEKQTQALFGRPDIRIAEDGSLDTSNDELVGITFSGLTMLVLEAVAFGSFLWEAESYVESKYHFVTN
ncbi:UV-B-induced protein At3g17800, chloroplastic isoform X2 [Elaeis guineensis]|uniref:UV-B-induced protein At3g17800, chloroplastic isoform X2 n=1 Tax=Elaeis guineensis var. tenera TaxID=51953 RepID=UPI003C6CC8EE